MWAALSNIYLLAFNRRLLEIDKHYSLELCFSIEIAQGVKLM